jgi:hypothetical protein
MVTRKKTGIGIAALVAVILGGVIAWLLVPTGSGSSHRTIPAAHHTLSASLANVHAFGDIDPWTPSYPNAWIRSQSSLASAVSFSPLLVPDSPIANKDNMTAAYVWPNESAVAMDFPVSAEPKADITQAYVEVWEATWRQGDPLAYYQSDLKNDPQTGKSIVSIDGTPALAVEAHSPDKDVLDHANPAFIRLETNGLEVEISGGESLNALMDVARSILQAGEKAPGTDASHG